MSTKRDTSDTEDETTNVIKRHKHAFKKMSEGSASELPADYEDQNIDDALLEQDNEKHDDLEDNDDELNNNEDAAVAAAVASAAANYDRLIHEDDSMKIVHEDDVEVTLSSGEKKETSTEYNDESKNEGSEDRGNEKVKSSTAPSRRGRKPMADAGTVEWKQQRKDSHKEVERRRRENINTAISKLSELLPVKESSKATTLARAAEYIQKLKETESANIEKWTLQKLVNDQNSNRLISTNEKLQEELGNAYKEIESLKKSVSKYKGRLKELGIKSEESRNKHKHKSENNED
ncbi:hypothetical protein TPHA_0F03530 [Tetrapisispora phaffii CBS 4417]|uniref:BHLH domain-containing protein n=1 Tax=Tetrapisispora phaffii (strain ATCC 24235 / CBS 4417 / NBRC 1672 / NRRL Y-8282 / UCD 70-5) TaxID=1071381 RepID=G8BUP7_TETPH|nr:hypothetical protein TPHA_0F03530 [Tetrapisispora phaffii CBS 4417]CCE63833.1 hypothetical protein TPHA_0F03530 [Tetrapisispora phaffii CBS 4417]